MKRTEVMRHEAQTDAMRYLRANQFLNTLRQNMDVVTQTQFKTLREQALKGDVLGAYRELQKIVMR